jgi:CheY-like chemotaxis protein
LLAFNDRVAVIDDNEDGRDTIIDELGDHNYKGVAITGRYGSDMQRLLNEIEAQDPGFVICDHRLTAQQFASFNGLQVVEALIARKRPGESPCAPPGRGSPSFGAGMASGSRRSPICAI